MKSPQLMKLPGGHAILILGGQPMLTDVTVRESESARGRVKVGFKIEMPVPPGAQVPEEYAGRDTLPMGVCPEFRLEMN